MKEKKLGSTNFFLFYALIPSDVESEDEESGDEEKIVAKLDKLKEEQAKLQDKLAKIRKKKEGDGKKQRYKKKRIYCICRF